MAHNSTHLERGVIDRCRRLFQPGLSRVSLTACQFEEKPAKATPTATWTASFLSPCRP